jgi:hypothetical protein
LRQKPRETGVSEWFIREDELPGSRSKSRRTSRTATVVVVAAALAAVLLAAGCGPQTPDQAVNNFYNAIQAHDWNAYLGAVLPENVRRMTQVEIATQKKKFLAADFTYKSLKLKTAYDKQNPSKASVELQAGVITGTNAQTGKKETTTIAEIKKTYGVTPTISTQKYKGRWYVDVPLSEVDQPTQNQ